MKWMQDFIKTKLPAYKEELTEFFDRDDIREALTSSDYTKILQEANEESYLAYVIITLLKANLLKSGFNYTTDLLKQLISDDSIDVAIPKYLAREALRNADTEVNVDLIMEAFYTNGIDVTDWNLEAVVDETRLQDIIDVIDVNSWKILNNLNITKDNLEEVYESDDELRGIIANALYSGYEAGSISSFVNDVKESIDNLKLPIQIDPSERLIIELNDENISDIIRDPDNFFYSIDFDYNHLEDRLDQITEDYITDNFTLHTPYNDWVEFNEQSFNEVLQDFLKTEYKKEDT